MRYKIGNFGRKIVYFLRYLSFGCVYQLNSGFNVINVHFLVRKSLQVDFFMLPDACISLIIPRPYSNKVLAHTLKIIVCDKIMPTIYS